MEVSKIVPQLFYDVIARGVPGGALIAGTSFALGDSASIRDIVMVGFSGSNTSISVTLSFYIVLMFYSYILGHIISPVGDWIVEQKIIKLKFDTYFQVLRDSVDPNKSKFPGKIQRYLREEVGIFEDDIKSGDEHSNDKFTSLLFIWSDWLRFKSADAGSRIVKLRAEYRMLLGLSVVGVYTVALHLVCLVFVEAVSLNIVLIISGILLSWLGFLGYCKGYRTFQYSVINNYYAEKEIEGDTGK